MNKTMIKTVNTALLIGAMVSTRAPAFDGAVFYEHPYFGGESLSLVPGEGIPRLSDYRMDFWSSWNDEISAVSLHGDVVVYLFEHDNYQGDYLALVYNADNLGWIDGPSWNNRTSSIYVDWYWEDGWYWDQGMESWVYWEGEWFYHEAGLEWQYGGYYDRTYSEGWIYDIHHWGWLYADGTNYPWFYNPDYGDIYYYHQSYHPQWWWTSYYGWIDLY